MIYGLVDENNNIVSFVATLSDDAGAQASPPERPTSPGASMIAAERQRQIEVKGWTPEHDDQHDDRELLCAAETYMFGDPDAWPWDEDSYKPKDKVTDLVRAGALIAAEIDRLIRQNQPMDSIRKV